MFVVEVVDMSTRVEKLTQERIEEELRRLQAKREEILKRLEEQEKRLQNRLRGVSVGKSSAREVRRLETVLGMMIYRYAKDYMPKAYADILMRADAAGYIKRSDVRAYAGLSPVSQDAPEPAKHTIA
jgi:DNA gyrase/topoisomerase IV subunit A